MTLSDEEKLNFFEGLGGLMASGIPLMDALWGLEADAPKKVKVILHELMDSIQQGKTIHESLSVYPQIFDGVTLSLINSGEESGSLDTVFDNITKNLLEEIAFKNKIKAALAYPITLTVVFVCMVVFIMVYAVPKFKYVFSKLSADIPLPTKVVFFVSDAIINYYPHIILGILGLALLVKFLHSRFKGAFLQTMYSLPAISTLFNYLDIYRLSKTMSLLLGTGVPLVTSLELCQNVVYKSLNLKRVAELVKHALTGKEISLYLKTQKHFMSQTMINLIEFGEKSGSLEGSFSKVANLAQTRVQTSLERVTSLLEPVAITVMGVTVGAVMMSIIAPIYQLIGNLNVR